MWQISIGISLQSDALWKDAKIPIKEIRVALKRAGRIDE
jgi:hypothetical protein